MTEECLLTMFERNKFSEEVMQIELLRYWNLSHCLILWRPSIYMVLLTGPGLYCSRFSGSLQGEIGHWEDHSCHACGSQDRETRGYYPR